MYEIKLFLTEYIMKALVINEHIYINTVKIVKPYFQSEHYNNQLKIMGWVILLVNLKISGGISYNFVILHQYTTHSNS